MYSVYILYSKTKDKFYIGHTSDLQLRLERHLLGTTKFTKQTTDWEIAYTEKFTDKTAAIKREKEIKNKKSRKYILKLISFN